MRAGSPGRSPLRPCARRDLALDLVDPLEVEVEQPAQEPEVEKHELGEEAVRDAIVDSLKPFRTESGRYRLENEWHYVIARP